MNGTAIMIVKDLLSLNTVRQRMKNHIPQGYMIPQYYTLKLKLPTYLSKENSIPQYRKPQCPP